MRIAISGSSGLVGSTLLPALREAGHSVTRLVRQSPRPDDVLWDPSAGTIDVDKLEGVEAVIHLAGENIAGGRWTAARKARILESRVQGTRLLSESLARLQRPPHVLVSASAIGYYGDRADEELTEASPPGKGFLPEVCQAWEDATRPAAEGKIRVVNLRIGIVLSSRGGALAKMLLPFRLGVGGRVGSGNQYWSWITLAELVRVMQFAIDENQLRGPVNAVAGTCTNREFTRALGKVLHRPTFLPMPAFAARLALGEMADALLLASARVLPEKLRQSGYSFQHPDLDAALPAALRG